MTIESTISGDASRNFNPASTAPFAATISGLRTIAAVLRACGEKLQCSFAVRVAYVLHEAEDKSVSLAEMLSHAQDEGHRPTLDENPGYDFDMIESLAEAAISLLAKKRALNVPDVDVCVIDEVACVIDGIPALVHALAAGYETHEKGLPAKKIDPSGDAVLH